MSNPEQGPEHMVEHEDSFLAPLRPNSNDYLPHEKIIFYFDDTEEMEDEPAGEDQPQTKPTVDDFDPDLYENRISPDEFLDKDNESPDTTK